MDVPLLISDQNGVFSLHGPFISSPSLFSPGISNPSNLDDDDVMFFRKFVIPLEEGLPNVHLRKEGLHTSSQSRESRNGIMTQLENFKTFGLLSFLGQNYV